MTPEFARDLRKHMKERGISQKPAAIRAAVREALERQPEGPRAADFNGWVGLGNQAPLNPSPRFPSEDKLWAPRS